ncbi:hypothetical protein HZ326_22407 [Fusarium oxysporum f. sp. albedinis]|nr:hypothetical protein HZ326_22407 [Fusarium oxysporum f. sp. albedinis]
MYTEKHSNPQGRAQRTILPEQDNLTNRPIRIRDTRDGPTAKSSGRAGLGVKDVKVIKVHSKLRPVKNIQRSLACVSQVYYD